MSVQSPNLTADQAIARLAALPPITDMGISFIGIMPDPTGALGGYAIALTTDAQMEIAEIAQNTREILAESTLLAYGPAVLLPQQHWMHVSASEAATLTAVEAIGQQADLLPFDATNSGKLKMVAARFTTKDQQSVVFYRIADSLMELKSSKILGLVRSGNVYSRLVPADVILLRTDFDVIVIDGFAFFRKKATFERAFGFLEELKNTSLSTFNAVTSQLTIQGMDDLRAACTSQPQMMAKMSSIKRSMDEDQAYAQAMTMSNLIAYIEQHPHVEIEIAGTGSDRQLVFDPSPKRRFQILKLLDDDFLHSVLTARDYEANSKSQTAT